MLGDTLTILAGGPGGSSNVLKKINQDQYASEYLLRVATGEVRMKVRHSTENSINGASPMNRHNVEFTRLYFADGSTYLEDTRFVMSVTIRAPASVSDSAIADWVHGVVHWLGAAALTGTTDDSVINSLVSWES